MFVASSLEIFMAGNHPFKCYGMIAYLLTNKAKTDIIYLLSSMTEPVRTAGGLEGTRGEQTRMSLKVDRVAVCSPVRMRLRAGGR